MDLIQHNLSIQSSLDTSKKISDQGNLFKSGNNKQSGQLQ